MQQGDLPERFARALVASEDTVFEDLHLAGLDQIEAVADITLDNHILAGRQLERNEIVAESLQCREGQRREDRVARKSM